METGLLKEFYPADDIENNIVYSIFRLKNGQIVPGAGTLDRFVKMRDEYMDAYNLLNDKMLESEDNRLMGNFIQIPELLYGCFDEDVESPAVYDEVDIKALSEAIDGAVPTSGYIWTRGVVGQSYGEFIKEIKRNSESNSDFKLLQVIQTVIALTEGVMSIHVAGLLHLDIKPSNFMLPYREGQIVNEHTISMYDVNTLYMVGGEYLNPMGTDGFCAPEIVEMEDQPDNRADIYSIGAVLFNAIIVKDGIGNELYVDETYGEIRQLVKSSKLFTSGEAGTNEEFMSLIVTILEKCLAPYRGGRYEACEDLLDDLEKALEIITRINCNRIGQNETLQVVKLNEAGISDPVIAIQKMLYDHPIYESLKFGNTEPKILVIGSGTYGHIFIDQCLQAGQIKGYELESTHPCIVYGTEETPLSTEEYNKYSESGREKWDVADIDPDLDELDLMSIKLHRCFRKRANEYKKNNPMQRESDIEKLRKLAEECGEDVSGAFRQYCFCLENILEGVENYTRQYSNYEKRLKKIFESSASEAVLKDAETRIALIKKAFFPVMEANLYRDYKSYDDVLVGKIPFILTYSFIEHVVVAFDESEEFNGRLNNVAAVTVLCPKKIDYIYYCDEHSDVDKVMTGLKAVLGYLDSREIHCQVRFVIAGSRECGTTNMLEKGLSGIESGKYQNVRFEGCTLLYCNPSQDAAYNEIVQYLQSDNCIYECSNLLFHDGKKYEAFKSVIKSAGIAYYSFDWRNKHFTKHNGCDYLQYIHDASFLTMENIAALKGTDSAISDIPEYQKDYEALWQIYESDKNAWRALCSCIDEYELRNKPLAQFEILGNECNEYTEKLSFVLPEYTEKTVRRLLRELSERDILRDDIIENYTSESYIVKFSVSKKYRHAFDTLFADPRILLDYYGVRAYNESKYVRVGYNNLEVVDISRIEENSYRMLEKLQDKHFINGLRREDSSDKVSFAFTSPRIKRVMMKTNRVLLLRAYYETLKYGYHEPNRIAYFDDVVYGSKIGNQDESDALFITKGFRHIKITDMGEWSDEQLACIGDTLNEKLRENNQ